MRRCRRPALLSIKTDTLADSIHLDKQTSEVELRQSVRLLSTHGVDRYRSRLKTITLWDVLSCSVPRRSQNSVQVRSKPSFTIYCAEEK
uniref:Uncharacterized protein n=1 Tax=Ascaris lumbricoides TaxID=6252 RepID=A0A0M3HWG5_ASCLU